MDHGGLSAPTAVWRVSKMHRKGIQPSNILYGSRRDPSDRSGPRGPAQTDQGRGDQLRQIRAAGTNSLKGAAHKQGEALKWRRARLRQIRAAGTNSLERAAHKQGETLKWRRARLRHAPSVSLVPPRGDKLV